ncbi:hypothetical protein MNBD_GAMMA08-2971 [hydrothermal vent metagenome]|uniref:Uncharacterized protein n=1 Tax=hydrothermal vent metagenome TaxID=652676 RepID=A0A3B0XV16_9ZZZZ
MSFRQRYKSAILLIIINLMIAPVYAHNSSHPTLVLVSSTHSSIEQLKPSLVRKIFLNFHTSFNNQHLTPLINSSNELLYEIFLQKVVYMSERNYDRYLIAKTFRSGIPRPEKFSNTKKLITALQSISGSVSVMWKKNAIDEKNIRIIQVLWEERR